MTEMELDRLSTRIAELEKPVARFSFERWKFTAFGTFLGVCIGSALSFILPKETVRSNRFLNSWLQPDNMTSNIYPSSVSGLLGWVGGIIGGTIDFFRDIKRPTEAEYTQKIKELRQQETTPPDEDLSPAETNVRMQERVAERRQEGSHQRTR